jgi:hypothetical protein
MGDSITEGVQSVNASVVSQPHSYVNLIAKQLGVSFPLPLILSSPFSIAENVAGRTRLNPSLLSANLGVSGATVDSLLNQSAGQPVVNETDLVLEPRTGTQMQIAQSLKSPFTVCWIGNNDALASVENWNDLTNIQLTSVEQFTTDYAQIVAGLSSWQGKVVVGTIPDIPQIGFVFTPQDLVTFLGSNFGLPEGSYTTLPTMLLIKLGLVDGTTILQNPNYVLSASNAALISQQVATFNQIIQTDAENAGFAVADIHAYFAQLETNPPVFHGVALTRRFNGGLLSLDGIHPSDTGHALGANVFIQAANTAFSMNIPLLSESQLTEIADSDPFIDWNGNLVVRGRPFTGLLETLGPFLGISGDFSDQPGSSAQAPTVKINQAAGKAFMQKYFSLKGLPPGTAWTEQDAINAMKDLFHSLL